MSTGAHQTMIWHQDHSSHSAPIFSLSLSLSLCPHTSLLTITLELLSCTPIWRPPKGSQTLDVQD
jgi:hypothetical protein